MRKALKYILLCLAGILAIPLIAQKTNNGGPTTTSAPTDSNQDREWVATCNALIDEGHIDRADSLFQTITFKKGDDSTIFLLQRRLEVLRRLIDRGPDGELTRLDTLNSKYDDFAAIELEEGIFFSSFRPAGNSRSYRGKPTAKIYRAQHSREHSSYKVGIYDPSIQDPWHNSNYCQMGDTIFFNRSSRKAFSKDPDGVSQLQVYMAVSSNGVAKVSPAPFNEDGYHFAHPFVDTLRNRIYFSSDRPDGYGKMDIWYVERKDSTWSLPVNAGEGINSASNEIFPSSFGDRLYFSSSKPIGFGGYDAYSAQIPPLEDPQVKNLGAPVNSPYDDLSPVFSSPDTALLASNRPAGMGGDDIYRWIRSYPPNLFRKLKGRLLKANNALPGQSLIVKTANGILIDKTKTDSAGEFKLHNIRGDRKYRIELQDKSPSDTALYQMELMNDKGETVKRVAMNANGNFVFGLLAPDDFDDLETIPNEDESLLEIDLRGEVFSKKPGDIKKPGKIYLLSVRNDTLATVKWDKKGQFIFKNLSPEDKYIIRPSVQKEELVVRLINEKGELMETLLRISDHEFLYERLSPDDRYILLQNEKDNPIKIKLGEYFDVPNIYYKLDEADILPESARQLDKLVKLLKNNPHVGIALTAHTDSRGTESYNLNLSRNRVAHTLEYLIENGIDEKRLSGEGKGEAELVNNCSDGVPCTEEEHARNRRTEFSVFTLK